MNAPILPIFAAGLRLKRIFCSRRARVEPPSSPRNPLSPSPWPGQQVFQGAPPKSKFLAVNQLAELKKELETAAKQKPAEEQIPSN